MIDVEEVTLDIELPEHSIGMVLMQPFIELDVSQEPFKWRAERRDKQLERIEATLELARGGCGLHKTNFTVFPEYSIPGVDGVELIQRAASNDAWPSNSVIIGGLDGLTREEYAQLCDEANVHSHNLPDRLRDYEWVNCCVTWAKSPQRVVRLWVQPKLAPAQLESNVIARPMYRGQAVYVFKCRFENTAECRFLSLICFDWIDEHSGLWPVLMRYAQVSGSQRDLHILFVPQLNPKPNDHLFLENARKYFEEADTCPTLNRIGGVVVFANAAGGAIPGKYGPFGFSSLVFHPTASFEKYGCPPTFAIDTGKLRAADTLTRCRQALLREMGPCVHSFTLRLPRWITPNPADRGHPLEGANVHPLDADSRTDPRTPGGPVAAIVKWFNDNLVAIDSLVHGADHPLEEEFTHSRRIVVDETRNSSVEKLEHSMNALSVAIGRGKTSGEGKSAGASNKWVISGKLGDIKRRVHNVDNWDEQEEQCLRYLVNALSVINVCESLEFAASPTHATMRIGNRVYDILVACGSSHQECDEWVSHIDYRGSAARTLIAITMDLRHPYSRRPPKSRDIGNATDSSAQDITSGSMYFCAYSDVVNVALEAADRVSLCNKLREVLVL
jgi:hypothetical protein